MRGHAEQRWLLFDRADQAEKLRSRRRVRHAPFEIRGDKCCALHRVKTRLVEARLKDLRLKLFRPVKERRGEKTETI